MFTYKNKKDDRVVKRESVWDSAEISSDWERVDNAVGEDSPPIAPNGKERTDQSDVDPFELAGGAPAEDLPGKVPGEVPHLSQMTRPELNEYAAAAGIAGAAELANRDDVLAAIREHEEAELEVDDEPLVAEEEPEAEESEGEPQEEELGDLSREELNQRASELGIEGAENLPNRSAVITAIREHDAESEDPEDSEGS